MKKWLVATLVDDGLEDRYVNYDIIEAETLKEAEVKYNRKHNCSYFYADCIGEFNEETEMVNVSVRHFIPRYRK